jgi:hypothetical protein
MPDVKEQIRELGAQAATGDQARALLGAAVTRLHTDGYEKLDDISTIVGLRAEVQSALDIGRAQADKIYAALPPGDAPLSLTQQNQVGAVLWFIAGALAREQQTADEGLGYLQGFFNGLKEVVGDAGALVPKLADALPWWVIPAAVVGAFLYLRRFLP